MKLIQTERVDSIYQLKTIKSIEEIATCSEFQIDKHLWNKPYKSMACGRMALLEGYGIVITMTAAEKNPLRRFYKENDPVYKDSALEAFLNFDMDNLQSGYFNFEINANGAMLSEFGISRNRRKINEITACSTQCEAVISDECWQVLLKIPMELICEMYRRAPLTKGDIFSCNFYKISEDPEIEHYAAYSKVISDVPNFHLPEYFNKVQVI